MLTEFGIDWQSDVLLRRLFEAFDRSRSGSVDFREFVLGLSIASKGTPNEKLDLSFKVYDIDGTGEVRKAEMVQVLSSVHRAARGRSTLGGNVDKFVAGLFEQADKTKNGTLTYLEYARAAMRFPNILEFKLAGDVDEEEEEEDGERGAGQGASAQEADESGSRAGGGALSGAGGESKADGGGLETLVQPLANATPYETSDVRRLLARFTEIAAASPDPTQIQEQQVRRERERERERCRETRWRRKEDGERGKEMWRNEVRREKGREKQRGEVRREKVLTHTHTHTHTHTNSLRRC